MEFKVGKSVFFLEEGDLTLQETEAIVNAANSRLAGGGGVDGAIHRAGGPAIMEESRKIGGCPTGQAVITTGGNLKAKYVIHTVGPIYQGGSQGEARLLASAYHESLTLAHKKGIRSLAFPSLSTGAYGYPLEEAARIAVKTVADYLRQHPVFDRVGFVLFGNQAFQTYAQAASKELQSLRK
ncbi:MAG: O-acetyl-ADP-ribose deacetylase [Deltaproteobacteria bacterium]|nr:O-acetyl-ADP-ribose deacetylase [Deltaproteobacteria bacterium]